MIEILDTRIKSFDYIIHFADSHIRLNRRHSEYREVFERFYKDIDETPENTIICNLGDTLHSKVNLSPECVQMASEFLWNLAERRETIIVPGNHDALITNKNRLDSISPIVDALNHPRLHYLTKSKLYGIGDILFNNMCIFDDPEKYIRGFDIPDEYRNQYKHIIALFHGAVDRAVTDTGYSISNPAIMPELFDWHHIALLGDIHKRQNIQVEVPEKHKPCVHFVGSLIQQNHGEPLHPHGYTIWNLKDYSYQYKELPNDYGYFTVEINGSQILTDLSDLPKKTYLRTKCLNSIATEVKAAEALISTMTELAEPPARLRVESEADKKAKQELVCKDVKLSEVADVDYQSKLITEFLQNKLNLKDQDKIDQILLINREVNTEIKKDEFTRNLKWVPVRFEWDNMFAYGEGNYIDFRSMNGVYGVFGPNTCGKSSIFSAICFCLFDKWERGFKAVVARNTQKQGFRCKFEFHIAGVPYFIEKIGETTKSGNVRVEVSFWREVNGVKEDLTDEMRRKTNDIIRDYVGTFEDFILTTFSVQTATKNNVTFIDMGNTERKDLLVQFMGLNVFDRLYDVAYAKGKELAAALKPHKEKNYVQELDTAETTLRLTEAMMKECQVSMDECTAQIRGINDNIVSETSRLIKLDSEVPVDLASLEIKQATTKKALDSKNAQIVADKVILENRRAITEELAERLSEIIVDDLVSAHKKYEDIRTKLDEEVRKHELKKVEVTNKLDGLTKLGEYQYDPKCKLCMKNSVVSDTSRQQTQKELEADQIEVEASVAMITDLRKQCTEWDWVSEAYQNYTKLLSDHSKAKDEYATLNTRVLLAEKDVEKLTQTLKELEKKIELYHRNAASVENNQKVNMSILSYNNALSKVEYNLNTHNNKLLELTGKKEVLKQQILHITETIEFIIKTEEMRQLFDYYTQAVGRNGIPYVVICNTLPDIEREINAILMQTADFTINLESDEKNIMAYINYETRGRWPIEMTSGFERFISSVAIRVALGNVSNLPRNNFLVLDEGFSTLDPNNLASMSVLFTHLKSQFDFVCVISHNDTIKDFVDKQIEIKQENGFSKVTFE